MYKFFLSILFSVSILTAAEPPLNSINGLENPTVVAERPGFYKFTLSGIIAANVLNKLSTIKSDQRYATKPDDQFRPLLSSFIYPHPSKVSGINTLWRGFTEAVINLRSALGASEEALPFFIQSHYEKLPTYQAAIAAFETHLKNAISKLALDLNPKDVNQIISSHMDQIHAKTKGLLESYAAFYASRVTPLRKHDIEHYITGLLHLCIPDPITPESLRVLNVLQNTGCLELFGRIENDRYVYSPAALVRDYIAKKGNPTVVILGCCHALELPCLEALGLKQEVWCAGSCKYKPHSGAMVVSLTESSADVFCDLNHPDLWGSIRAGSLDSVHDETWSLGCYTPETLASIARVLRIGGVFSSHHCRKDNPTIAALLGLGFVVIEESLQTDTLKLRKGR